MKSNVIITIICVFSCLHQITDATLSLAINTVLVIVNTSFVQFIEHHESETITKCTLKYTHENIYNQLMISMQQTQDFSNETVFGKRLTNLERNLCGFRIDKHQSDDPGNMTLEADYIKADKEVGTFTGTFEINSIPVPEFPNEIMYVILGSSAKIECGKSYDDCTLYDPYGNLVKDTNNNCMINILHVKMNHVGNWTCFKAEDHSPTFYKWHIELKLTKEPVIQTWYKEEDGFGLIGCRYVSEPKINRPEFCQFIDPQKQIYTVSETSCATERYTSVGTDYEELICQIEFKLPIKPEEIGNWMCMVNTQTGGFINVSPSNRMFRREDLDYPKHLVINIELGTPLNIFCQVPYSSDNCYINSPTSEYILGGDINNFRLGECKTSIKTSEVKHLGVWTCHYSDPKSVFDDVIEIEVKEHNSVRFLYKDIESSVSQSVELMCKATIPIQTCQYIGPSGLSYNVFPEKKAEGIDYVGDGLQYGDCGLRIDSVKPEHDGIWTCIINNIKSPDKYLQDVSRVYVRTFTVLPFAVTTSSIGIAVGVMAGAVLILGVAVYTRFRYRSPSGRSSNASNESNVNQPIVNAQIQPVYSTNEGL